MVTADDKTVIELHLSGGDCHDAPEGRKSLDAIGKNFFGVPVVMDKAYEGDNTRETARNNGHEPVVPPKSNRSAPWEYDKALYKRRNVVERLFRRIQEFRRIFTRYDKLDEMFLTYIYFALSVIWLK